MRLINFLFISFLVSETLFSQIKNFNNPDSSELDATLNNSDSTKTMIAEKEDNSELLKKLLEQEIQRFKIVPIPPATIKNRKVELLPPYKHGNVVMRLIKK